MQGLETHLGSIGAQAYITLSIFLAIKKYISPTYIIMFLYICRGYIFYDNVIIKVGDVFFYYEKN